MKTPTHRTIFQQRIGFTLLELLVSISIIALLISLVLPAIQNSRAAARRVQCQNNIRNLAIGLSDYATTSGGYLPSVFSRRNGSLAVWTTEILPQVDAKGIFDRLKSAPAPDVRIPVFVCPDDAENEDLTRGLSYVVNVGYGRMTPRCTGPPLHEDTITVTGNNVATASQLTTLPRSDGMDGYELGLTVISVSIGPPDLQIGIDWDDSGDVSKQEELATTATGVFWTSHNATNREFSLRRLDLGDGTSNTMLLSERDKKRDWAVPPLQPTMNLTEVFRLRYLAPMTSHGFGISTAAFRNSAGVHVMPKEGSWTARPLTQQLSYELIDTRDRYDCPPYVPESTRQIINRPTSFQAPPTSDHTNGVNVAFCDGSVVFLSESVDPDVYARLLTSAGSQNGQEILSQTEF